MVMFKKTIAGKTTSVMRVTGAENQGCTLGNPNSGTPTGTQAVLVRALALHLG